jgi:hypothetical protein
MGAIGCNDPVVGPAQRIIWQYITRLAMIKLQDFATSWESGSMIMWWMQGLQDRELEQELRGKAASMIIKYCGFLRTKVEQMPVSRPISEKGKSRRKNPKHKCIGLEIHLYYYLDTISTFDKMLTKTEEKMSLPGNFCSTKQDQINITTAYLVTACATTWCGNARDIYDIESILLTYYTSLEVMGSTSVQRVSGAEDGGRRPGGATLLYWRFWIEQHQQQQ